MCYMEFMPFHKSRREHFRMYTSALDKKYVPPHESIAKRILLKITELMKEHGAAMI